MSKYIGNSMRCTQSSMELVSTVIGFDIVELWTEDEEDHKLHCTYVHADDSLLQQYPGIIVGHYPNHKKQHLLSPRLCELARSSSSRYYWNVMESDGDSRKGRSSSNPNLASAVPPESTTMTERSLNPTGSKGLHPEMTAPVQTEMAYMLEDHEETSGMRIFIVGFALDRIEFSAKKLRFLSGIGFAIFVAAFDLDDDDVEHDGAGGTASGAVLDKDKDLDLKTFLPRPLSSQVLSTMLSSTPEAPSTLVLGMGVWSQSVEDMTLAHTQSGASVIEAALRNSVHSRESRDRVNSLGGGSGAGSYGDKKGMHMQMEGEEAVVGLDIDSSSESQQLLNQQKVAALNGQQQQQQQPRSQPLVVPPGAAELAISAPGSGSGSSSGSGSPSVLSPPSTPVPSSLCMPPTWDPVDAFSFPVAEIPVSFSVPDNLLMEHFADLQHITDGSNANIFLARFNSEKVIIKMIKEEVQLDPVAVHEFDVEHGMLSRINHPNIIRLKGAGRIPRRFIVLEYLGGGSLSSILSQNQAKPGLAQKLFRRPSFTYATLLSRARDMAESLHFLNEKCHPGATIIHRDLKPDNVGFTSSGVLKLFDFGLCTCVRRRSQPDEAYEMTGNTGSLRYMAPEVAMRKAYNEKADVYSFGIMVWQMARDRVPFKGMNREDFMQMVVVGGERPKLDKSWPMGFSNLLVTCWDRDPSVRPTFAEITAELGNLLDEAAKPLWPGGAKTGRNTLAGAAKKSERQSTWF